jgi:protein-S-isoprenylcysteine O-methyltransferase Ste14
MLGHLLLAVLIGAWLCFETWLTTVHSRLDANRETTTKWVMSLSFFGGALGGFAFEPARAAFMEPFGAARFVGLLIIACGFALRVTAVRQLGDNFNVDPQVRPDQKLMRQGVYSVVRHPGYLADLLAYIGLAVVYLHPIPSLLVVVVPVTGLLYRIRIEEAMLDDAFGAAYQAYREETSALIPWIY